MFKFLKKILKGDGFIEMWFDKSNKHISIRDFRYIRKQNYLEYGDDSYINIKRQWGIRTNGAKKENKKDTCLDWYLSLGHIQINYTNFNYNKKLNTK